MATYFNDFSQYTLGTFPSDWLAFTEAADAGGGIGDERALRVVDLSSEGVGTAAGLKYDAATDEALRGDYSRIYIWDAVAASSDQEIYFEFYLTDPSLCEMQGALRADYSTLPTKNWYQGGVRPDDLDLNKFVGGTFANLANDTSKVWASVGEWYKCRFRVNGTTLSVKVWADADPEPASFQVTDTDPDLSSGQLGIQTFRARIVYVRNVGASDAGETAPTEAATSTPTITDINANNEVTPGETATLTGTNLTGATGFNIGSEAQTDFTVVSDTSITFTTVRGGNPYNQDLTGTLLHPDGNQTITVQQVPEAGTFAVTAASPNTTDDASLWTGLIDTATSDPITIVDGDQAWVKNPNNLTNLAIQPDGTITADQTGDFVVQIWLASEGVWGSDQTVTFEEETVDPPVDPPEGVQGLMREMKAGIKSNLKRPLRGLK